MPTRTAHAQTLPTAHTKPPRRLSGSLLGYFLCRLQKVTSPHGTGMRKTEHEALAAQLHYLTRRRGGRGGEKAMCHHEEAAGRRGDLHVEWFPVCIRSPRSLRSLAMTVR